MLRILVFSTMVIFRMVESKQERSDQPSECTSYTSLNDASRKTSHFNYLKCDVFTAKKWYRFTTPWSTLLPEYCVTEDRCGTTAPGWLNGKHPKVAEGIVNRTVCYNRVACCMFSNTIRVRNCGEYYVYELQSPPRCHLRYCTQDNNECTNGKHNCDLETSDCIKTNGSFECQCKSGRLKDPKTGKCVVTYKCTKNTTDCHLNAICYNINGSSNCVCLSGFSYNGTHCEDVNECTTEANTCQMNVTCRNTYGSYQCLNLDSTTTNTNTTTATTTPATTEFFSEKNPDKIRDADDGTRSRKISNVRNESSKSQTIPIIVVVIVVAVGILVVFAIYKYKKMVAARPEGGEAERIPVEQEDPARSGHISLTGVTIQTLVVGQAGINNITNSRNFATGESTKFTIQERPDYESQE